MGRTSEILRAPMRAAAAIPPATRAVALACLAVHLMQRVVAAAPIRTVFLGAGGGEDLLLVPDVLSFLFAISGGALSLGFLWTPVTYLFLHAGWSHLLLNGIGLLGFEHDLSCRLSLRYAGYIRESARCRLSRSCRCLNFTRNHLICGYIIHHLEVFAVKR